MHIVGANAHGRIDRGRELATEAREGGIIEEIRLENSVRNPQRSASMFDLILYDLCRREPNLRLLLNTSVVSARVERNRVVSATAIRPSTEEEFTIGARVYVDCTGDGRLAAEAGAAFMEGREGRDDFGESLAPERADRKRLGSTLLMQARRHDRPCPFTPPPWVRRFTRHDLRHRLYAVPGEETPTLEYGCWWVEWGGELDTIADNELIRDELAAIALGVWDHIKNGAAAERWDAACWALEWFGFVPGKRESRRFIGRHILTQNDLTAARSFPDAIAYGGWPLDLHPPGGIDAADELPCAQHPLPFLYSIPLRACVARDLDNLMFAGRNISATHVAFSSTRVMATCAAIGQGAGTAAAVAVEREIEPSALAESDQVVREIQQQLLRDDAFLLGVEHEDASDLARLAEIRASSSEADGEPEQIRSGVTRAVHGELGAAPGTVRQDTHRWMSDSSVPLPAWIELRWPQPISIGEVRIVFDTGLHRHLTLTHHDGYASRMCWGAGQPETVRDYSLLVESSGTWEQVDQVGENYQRLRVHRMSCPDVDALRLVIERTWGCKQARICEIRVYGLESG